MPKAQEAMLPECRMELYAGFVAYVDVLLRRALMLNESLKEPECRMAFLPAAEDAISCARACLEQPLCEASTWFGPTFTSNDIYVRERIQRVRGKCFGRTSGTPASWTRTGEPYGHVLTVSRDASWSDASQSSLLDGARVVSALRWCAVGDCGLQRQLDARCRRFNESGECPGAHVARNTRGAHGVEDFSWTCVKAPQHESPPELSCVDDRGQLALCPMSAQVCVRRCCVGAVTVREIG